MGGGPPAPDTYAQDKSAAVSREMYDYYKTNFAPLEDQVISEMNNPNLIPNAVNAARGITTRAVDASNNASDVGLSRYGVNRNKGRDTSIRRGRNLNKGLSLVTASNEARRATDDYKTKVLEGVGSLGRQTAGDAVQGFGLAANLESRRNNTNRQIAAQNEQATYGSIGTGVGIAATFI